MLLAIWMKKLVLEMEDPDIVIDFEFWMQRAIRHFLERFFQDGIGVAVDNRRHGVITHLARAISVPDLLEQVKCRCPD